jgi:hypothetical protein
MGVMREGGKGTPSWSRASLLTSNAASCRSVSPRGGLTSVSLNQDGSMDGEGEGEGSPPLMSTVLYCCACFVVLQLLHLLLLLCSATATVGCS